MSLATGSRFNYLTIKSYDNVLSKRPQMPLLLSIPLDDAEKSSVSYTALTCSKQCLHNTKREDLAESTGVVPAKYPPKVKLELLTTLKC